MSSGRLTVTFAYYNHHVYYSWCEYAYYCFKANAED
jgi:hypothetical protein